jgi:PII-like signaling protein
MGFGHSSRLHTAKILRLSEDLPVVIEIVDTEEKIKAFLPILDEVIGGGLITLEKVQVLQYGTDIKHDPA